jgi:hypothetical protein
MREIYVDSRRRKQPYGNSYTLFIQQPIKNISSVDLVSATVPNTLFNITDGNGIFTVNGNVYSIPGGFYSSKGIYKTINSSNCEISMSLFENEGKFIFVSSNPFNLQINSNEFINITGFSSGVLYSNVATTSNGIYDTSIVGQHFIKSSNVLNMKTYGEYVFLDIAELRRPYGLDAVEDPYSSFTTSHFAVIPLDVQSGCIKTFKEHTDYKFSVEYPHPIDKLDRLTIRWLDSAGNVVNFNGVEENQCVLRFHTVDTPIEEPDVVDRTAIDDYIVKVKERLQEELVKKPEKKTSIGRWFVLALIILAITGIYIYKT